MSRNLRRSLLLGLAVLPALRPPVEALIHPDFTPVQLVRQADSVLLVKFSAVPTGGKARADVGEILKGKFEARSVVFDLNATAFQAKVEPVIGLIKTEQAQHALLFAGNVSERRAEEPVLADDETEETRALLHVGGQWLVFWKGDGNVWEFDDIDSHLQGTWAGGTDMLIRAVQYILGERRADVPAKTAASWKRRQDLPGIAGKVYAARPVDVRGDGTLHLHISAEEGDRLFVFHQPESSFKDVTAEHALRSRSRVAAWADFNADGSLDLLGWDGKSMVLHQQTAAGKFKTENLPTPATIVKNCLSIAVVDSGVAGGERGRPAAIVGTPVAPFLWIPGEDEAIPLSTDVAPEREPPIGGKCLVADFDRDAVPDVLQLFSDRGLFFRGKTAAVFEEPTACSVALGPGRSDAFVGDYDGDGLLDVFAVADDTCRLWHNLGGARFAETLQLSGEIAYISKPGGVSGITGDINNDGRQDVLVAYSRTAPQLFFNRGFRSFGHSHMLDLAENQLLPAADEGTQAACLGDFSGDGAQDLIVVCNNGAVSAFLRDIDKTPGRSVRVALPVGGPYAGPLTVTGAIQGRSLGAWNVVPGTSEAFLARLNAGPCYVQWRFPGSEAVEKKLNLINKPQRFVIGR